MNYDLCFHMEQGKTYDIKYVYHFPDGVRVTRLTFSGEFHQSWDQGKIPLLTVLPEDVDTRPGPIYIVGINEVDTKAEIK